MKKKKWLGIMLAGVLGAAPCGIVWAEENVQQEDAAQESTQQEDAAQEEGTSEDAQESAADNTAAELSDDLYSFQLEYDGVVYQLPMAYADLTAQGWELSEYDDPEQMIGSNSYTSVGFVKGDRSIRADIVNLGINEAALTECLVGGLSVDEGYTDVDFTQTVIRLPKGITMGQSNMDDIKAAYGEPSDTYEGDNYVQATYQMDMYQDVELYVYKDDNTLKQVSLRNFTEPEGYDKGSVSEEIPEAVSAYTAPAELSGTFMDPTVEFLGDMYTLPAPVSAFEANGWTMVDVEEDAFVEGGGLAFFDMMKENQNVRFSVYNLTENAVAMENCFVTELSHATYDPEILSMKLAGNISLGADKNELISTAEENGYTYEDDTENGYLTIYKNSESKLDTYLEVWFNKEVSETAAASLTYHNEVLPQ